MKDIRTFLTEFDFKHCENVQVQRIVVSRLKSLIPEGVSAGENKLHVIGFALLHLCAPNSLDDVDWPAVVGLASDLCNLYEHGWLK